MKNSFYFTLFIAAILLPSCATDAKKYYYKPYNRPLSEFGLKSLSPSEVVVRSIPESAFEDGSKSLGKWLDSMGEKNLVNLGSSNYSAPNKSDKMDFVKFAASIGARYVYFSRRFGGVASKTVTVPVAYTTGGVVNSTSQTYGSVNTSNYGYGRYSGTSNTTTYVPGTTTYGSRHVNYDNYDTLVRYYALESDLSKEGLARERKAKAARMNY